MTARLTVPVNPPKLDTVRIDDPEEPARKDRLVGEALMVKSWRGVMSTRIVEPRIVVPLIPVAPKP